MWRTQDDPLLIDLGFYFFIINLGNKDEYVHTPTEGPWIIGDDYLHVQWWHPNFIFETEIIKTLPV